MENEENKGTEEMDLVTHTTGNDLLLLCANSSHEQLWIGSLGSNFSKIWIKIQTNLKQKCICAWSDMVSKMAAILFMCDNEITLHNPASSAL